MRPVPRPALHSDFRYIHDRTSTSIHDDLRRTTPRTPPGTDLRDLGGVAAYNRTPVSDRLVAMTQENVAPDVLPVSDESRAVIRKCTARRPEDRYQTPDQLLADLDAMPEQRGWARPDHTPRARSGLPPARSGSRIPGGCFRGPQ